MPRRGMATDAIFPLLRGGGIFAVAALTGVRSRRPSGRHHVKQRKVRLLSNEPHPTLPPNRLAQQAADAIGLRMVGLEAENAIVALEEHPAMIGPLFQEFRGHVVVGAEQFGHGLSFAESDADGMLTFLASPGQPQVRRVVGVREGEIPAAPFLEMERSAACTFLNLPDDQQFSRGSCVLRPRRCSLAGQPQAFPPRHTAAPGSSTPDCAVARSIIAAFAPSGHTKPPPAPVCHKTNHAYTRKIVSEPTDAANAPSSSPAARLS